MTEAFVPDWVLAIIGRVVVEKEAALRELEQVRQAVLAQQQPQDQTHRDPERGDE